MSDTDPAQNPVHPEPEPLGGGAGDADRHDPVADGTRDAVSDDPDQEDFVDRLDPGSRPGQVKG